MIWDVDIVSNIAMRFDEEIKFKKQVPGVYQWIIDNYNLDLFCSHMERIKPRTFWTLETAKQEALKYRTRGEFQFKAMGAFMWAKRNGKLDDVCSHIKKPKRWDFQTVKQVASGFVTLQQFRDKKIGAYNWAVRNNCINEITQHMR